MPDNADNADNENRGPSAGGERRAALQSNPVGGGSTRIRETGFPMRKASTLPDVSEYTGHIGAAGSDESAEPADTRTTSGEGTDPATTVLPRTAQPVPADPSDIEEKSGSGHDGHAPDTSSLSIRPPEEDVHRRASQRDEAAAAKPLLPRILQVVVAVFFPVILLAAAVRAVTTPLFLWAEYHRPGFPADSYGFSTEDRMTYGSYTMDYILNWAPARYLGDLVNRDGSRLFLDSEVGHMADVKLVLSSGFVVATVLALIAVAACVYLARRYPGGIRRALFGGAAATLVLAVLLAVLAALAWETFFTQVHALFFADGTWTFRLDDTLIRLFPAQFWIDAAATVGALVLIGAVLTLVFTWPTKTRREKSAEAYAARRASRSI